MSDNEMHLLLLLIKKHILDDIYDLREMNTLVGFPQFS